MLDYFWKAKLWAEVNELVRYLPSKYENLTSIPRNHVLKKSKLGTYHAWGVSIKFYLKLLGFKMGHFFTMSRDQVKKCLL